MVTDWKGIPLRISRSTGTMPGVQGETHMSHNNFGQVLRYIVFLLIFTPTASLAGGLCEAAAERAARNNSVPLPILQAVALAETGRNPTGQREAALRPWPWTIHSNGRGHWFATRTEAVHFVTQLIGRGQRNIDIGCFQINLHWHGAKFRTIDQMFDPQANADYAAQFLSALFRQTQDWRSAVGRYHSRNPDKSAPYLERLERLYEAHLVAPTSPETVQPSIPAVQTVLTPPRQFRLISARGPLLTHRSAARSLIGAAP